MLSKEIFQKIRRIQITTSRLVTDVFAGQYHSVFKGRGMEFDEVREYLPGDEIRFIDWNVTARMGTPFVKKFVEERELTVMLLLDMSRSCSFGTVNQLKSQLAAELCSVLAFSAIQNNDKVGFIGFTDRIERFVPPRKGLRHVLRVIRDAIHFKAEGEKTDIASAVEYLNRVTKRRTVLFIISDFYAEGFKKALSIANRRHDIIAVTITDPSELALPDAGIVKLDDAETGDEFWVDSSDRKLREKYAKDSAARLDERKRLFGSINVDHIDIRTDTPYTESLIKFFKMRTRKRMRH
jgi:uncharacterized protein (DUF58 family)